MCIDTGRGEKSGRQVRPVLALGLRARYSTEAQSRYGEVGSNLTGLRDEAGKVCRLEQHKQ